MFWIGQIDEFLGDGWVCDCHDDGGDDEDDGQHVQLETSPLILEAYFMTSCFKITPPRLPYRAKCPATDLSVLKLSYFLWKDSMERQYHTLPLHTSIPKYHIFMSTHTHFAVASVASLHHFINVWKQIKCIGTNGSVLNL